MSITYRAIIEYEINLLLNNRLLRLQHFWCREAEPKLMKDVTIQMEV